MNLQILKTPFFVRATLTVCASALLAPVALGGAGPVGAGFTYQGLLKQGGTPYSGAADLEYKLFETELGITQIGGTISINNLSVVEGVFTSSLNFSAAAFNGEERWLEVRVRTPAGSANPFVTLAPRQRISASPYAVYALNAMLPATYGSAVQFTNASNTFAGNGSNLANLNAANLTTGVLGSGRLGGTYTNAVTFSSAANAFVGAFSGSGASITNLNASNIATGNLASARLPTGGSWPLSSNLTVDGGTLTIDTATNSVGIGETAPARKLDVKGAPNLGGSLGQMRIRDTANTLRGLEVGFQNSGINAFLQTVKAPADTLFPRLALQPNGGFVGIGTSEPANQLTVSGDTNFMGNVSIGTNLAQATLDVRRNGFVSIFDRLSTDGTIVSLRRSGSEHGSITISGILVSYNAFTGSHYAWSDAPIERYALVRMTGENRRLRGEAEAEVLYGIAPTSQTNDPACLGAYLAVQNPEQPAGDANPHMVMAVGNGEMWVTSSSSRESGIRAGEFLISSDVEGCAMRDDPDRFGVGYIIARAAEHIDWASVAPDVRGSKRARISVFFESFVRDSRGALAYASANAPADDRHSVIAVLRQRNEELEQRLRAVEQALQAWD